MMRSMGRHGRLCIFLLICHATSMTDSSTEDNAEMPFDDDASAFLQSPGIPGAPYTAAFDSLAGLVMDLTEGWMSKSTRGKDAKNRARALANNKNIEGPLNDFIAHLMTVQNFEERGYDNFAGRIYAPTPAPTSFPTHLVVVPTPAPYAAPTSFPTPNPTAQPSDFANLLKDWLRVMIDLHEEVLLEYPAQTYPPTGWTPNLREAGEMAIANQTKMAEIKKNKEAIATPSPTSELPTDCKNRRDGLRFIRAASGKPFKVRCSKGEVITPYTE